MLKLVRPRAERDRSTDIEIVRKNCNLSAENDIIVSIRLDKNSPRVTTQKPFVIYPHRSLNKTAPSFQL